MNQDDWLLDITLWDTVGYCFVPYDKDSDIVYTGLNVIQDRCPGNLVGVMNEHGRDEANLWVQSHPNWYEEFRKL